VIGFTGPYSDVNFGDYAMLVNNVYTLDVSAVTIFMYDRQFIETIRDRYFHGRDVRLVDVRFRPDTFAEDRDYEFLTPVEILRALENVDELREAVSEVETLYVNGGGYLNSLWTKPHRIERLLQILAPALIAATMNKPIVFTANGYGPFRGDQEFFASVFGLLKHAKFGARDAILSPHWLRQVGVSGDRIHLLPDDLLFLDDRLVPEPRPRADKYVVMETYLPMDFIRDEFKHFERFVNRMQDDFGARTIFLPLNLGIGGVDQGQYLAERLDPVELFDITEPGYLPIEDAQAVIRDAELVISSRYHAVIMALSLGTPFVSVLRDVLGDKQYYYGKNVGALERILSGQPHDLRDYFFLDYVEALEHTGSNFDVLIQRQRQAHSSAFPRNAQELRQARAAYLELPTWP
jgi:hypothetical protein